MSRPRRPISCAAALALTLLVACGGGSSAPTGPGNTGGTSQDPNQAPDASISSPAPDATFQPGENVDFAGSAEDPEDGSLAGDALAWSSDLDGDLGTGGSLSRNDLSEGAHTITLTATDGDGGTGTDQVEITVGTAGGQPSGTFLPLEEGRRWRYTEFDETTVCGGSTGCSTTVFEGRHFVRVEENVSHQGRSAWRMRIYSFRDNASPSDYAFDATSTLVSRDATGLQQWIVGSAEWRTVFSTTTSSVQNGTFFLVDGPPRDRNLTMSSSSTTVPYGSFSTLRVGHEYRQTGPHAPEDIFDSASEHFAPDVGMVRGSWDYSYDDNDPSGTDVISAGSLELTHVDVGPFPDLVPEAEPNDDHGSATALSPFAIGEGDIQSGDAGVVLTDAEVGCTLAGDCVHPDTHGEKVIHDWFRLELAQQTDITIALDFQLRIDGMTPAHNDLDLYLFEADGSGGLRYMARAAGPPGEREQLSGTLEAGTYYVGIQAWDTPSGRTPLWLAVW